VSDSPSAEAGLVHSPVRVGMLTFLATEVAFFGTLIMTYVIFLPQTRQSSPSPRDVFSMPMVLAGTICLLSSSVTIHTAELALQRGSRTGFLGLWGLTILLGGTFLAGTALEWHDLIYRWNLTISRNLFGSTYFTLVGFHAAHVTVGLIVLSTVWALVLCRRLPTEHAAGVQVVSWYWHFVDGVWVVVFTLVYIIGR
jgi:cytochrome c oxidase subunit 3